MAKGTLIFIFILSIFASLLAGINIGKRIEKTQLSIAATPAPSLIIPTSTITPSFTPTPSASISSTISKKAGISTYKDGACGFQFSYPGSYLNQKTVNGQSTIFTDPNNTNEYIVTACNTEIPAPPLPPEKIESITLDGITATLYHDTSSKDGTPRDEVIVKHPTNEKEIIIAGFGLTFQAVLTSFRFLE